MKRGSFNSKLGFILAASGSAVGLGNIWKFPFEVSNGGGAAFLVMYLLFCFILCFPVIVSEIAIGRSTKKNAIGAFDAMGKKKVEFYWEDGCSMWRLDIIFLHSSCRLGTRICF